ncbi:MAG: hypothetical protein Q8M99_10105 [Methylotenera sp.]|nr:hypothetical protein [Methylotenera sp.]
MKISTRKNNQLLRGVWCDSDYAQKVTDGFLNCMELVGKLIYDQYFKEHKIEDTFGADDLEILIESLETKYPEISEGELDFMAKAVSHCFYASIGIGPLEHRDGASDEDTKELAELPFYIAKHETIRQEFNEMLKKNGWAKYGQ